MKGRIPCDRGAGRCQKPACPFCIRYARDVRYRRHWGGGSLKVPVLKIPEFCRWEGDILEHCPRGEAGHVHQCFYEGWEHDRCTRGPNNGRYPSCSTCRFNTSRPPSCQRLLMINHQSLYPHLSGMRFNCSLIADGDGYVFAWRDGWRGSNIWACRMTPDFQPLGDAVRLDLPHKEANYGREDPRLFRFRGQLHVSFIGVVGGRRIRHTSQLYARMGDDLRVQQVFYAQGYGRRFWEKNHGYFEHDGQLYAVYTINPHRVLRIDDETASEASTSPGFSWPCEEPRGGAPPVRVGNEFWSFFHSRQWHNGRLRYNVGLYCFQAAPPFAITRYVPEPIFEADLEQKHDNYADVVFTGGAVPLADNWLIAVGVHDRWSEILSFHRDELEARMVKL